jgi:hypothetical protein
MNSQRESGTRSVAALHYGKAADHTALGPPPAIAYSKWCANHVFFVEAENRTKAFLKEKKCVV